MYIKIYVGAGAVDLEIYNERRPLFAAAAAALLPVQKVKVLKNLPASC